MAPSQDPSATAPPPRGLRARVRAFFRRHGRKLWWLHSLYALSWGVALIVLGQRGFEHARWLLVTVGATWIALLIFFRFFASGRDRRERPASPGEKIRFVLLTYVLKNLYQGMLFFSLPFYWKAASLDSPNRWFLLLLAVCAVLSTMDIIFDHYVMRWRWAASLFYGLTLFAVFNLILPALLPNLPTLYTLLGAAGFAVAGFWTMNFPLATLTEPRWVAVFLALMAGVSAATYFGRAAIPPAPLYLASAAVGPRVLPDGRLAMEVSRLHVSLIGTELHAVTDVVVPGGSGDRFHHVWRRHARAGEDLVFPREVVVQPGPRSRRRIRSTLSGAVMSGPLTGTWTVDVETADGRLVGRARLEVFE